LLKLQQPNWFPKKCEKLFTLKLAKLSKNKGYHVPIVFWVGFVQIFKLKKCFKLKNNITGNANISEGDLKKCTKIHRAEPNNRGYFPSLVVSNLVDYYRPIHSSLYRYSRSWRTAQGRSQAWAWGLKPPKQKYGPPNEMKPISPLGLGLCFLLDLSKN